MPYIEFKIDRRAQWIFIDALPIPSHDKPVGRLVHLEPDEEGVGC